MEFRDTPEEAAFRNEVRDFVRTHLPNGWDGESEGYGDSAWKRAVIARGWIAPHWPKEYGGAGMSPGEQFIFNEELAEARAPSPGGIGVSRIGPILILHGTEEQRREHLPRITDGSAWWCQGYSEPGAGSDLASLQTRAVRDGDEWVINGQKIWTSRAHRATWMFLLARTDPNAPKHRGITMFLADMKSPGITVRPLINMAGRHDFNQVFLENVRIPAANVVGEVNRGWYVGAALLDFERSEIGAAVTLRHTVNDLVAFAHAAAGRAGSHATLSNALRMELAERSVESEVSRLICYRIISMQKRGQTPNHEASMNKVFRTEAVQRVARTGMKLIGLYGNLLDGSAAVPFQGRLASSYLTSAAITVGAGTSEIQRNVIATRGLGLPRD